MKEIIFGGVMIFSALLTFNPTMTSKGDEVVAVGTMETVQPIDVVESELLIVEPLPEEATPEPSFTQYDVDLLSLVTMAEAEGESERGQRLVVDAILNRVDSPKFPNSIEGVVYQKNQFESMWNGRVDHSSITDEMRELVIEELENRTNYDVLHFRTNHYHRFGTPLFQEGHHYFSK